MMNTEIIQIDENYGCAIITYNPQKRTILWHNKPRYVNFPFYTTFIIPFFKYNDLIIQINSLQVFARETKDDNKLLYCFNFPHAAPDTMLICGNNSREFYENIDDLINNQINMFWNANNKYYVDDYFAIANSCSLEEIVLFDTYFSLAELLIKNQKIDTHTYTLFNPIAHAKYKTRSLDFLLYLHPKFKYSKSKLAEPVALVLDELIKNKNYELADHYLSESLYFSTETDHVRAEFRLLLIAALVRYRNADAIHYVLKNEDYLKSLKKYINLCLLSNSKTGEIPQFIKDNFWNLLPSQTQAKLK